MPEQPMVDIPQEGANPFGGGEEDTSSASPAENNEDESRSDQGDGNTDHEGDQQDNQPDDADKSKDVPFHKHPRWKEREQEWTDRFNEQEKRHQDELQAINEKIEAMNQSGKNGKDLPDEVPGWFGGDPKNPEVQKAWQEFKQWDEQRVSQAKDQALKEFQQKSSAEQKAIQEATDYMNKEIDRISKDPTLNPDGKKVNPNKLLKFVMDNDLVNSKGQWNYEAGWKIMLANEPKTDNSDKKKIAAATSSNNKGDFKPRKFMTTDDFKSQKPW